MTTPSTETQGSILRKGKLKYLIDLEEYTTYPL